MGLQRGLSAKTILNTEYPTQLSLSHSFLHIYSPHFLVKQTINIYLPEQYKENTVHNSIVWI